MSDEPSSKRAKGRVLEGKTVCMLIDYQYEDMEVQYPKIRLEEEGAVVLVVSSHKVGTKVTGKYGYPTPVDKHISECSASDFDAVVCPGGFAPDYYRRNEGMKALVQEVSHG